MSLLIPVAVDTSMRLVHAHAAKKGSEYRCPSCGDIVIWRRCDDVKRRSHFAHSPSSSCSGESATHASAKRMAAQILGDWQRGETPRPMLSFPCIKGAVECDRVWLPVVATTELPQIERMLDCGYIPDVFASPLAIEVLFRHPIPAVKVDAYHLASIPWIEVDAEGLLEDPPRWQIVRADELPVCGACSSRLQAEARRVAKEREQAAGAVRALGRELADRRRDLGAIDESVKRAESMATDRIADAQRSAAQANEFASKAVARAMDAADRDKVRLLKEAEADVGKLRETEERLAFVSKSLAPLEARFAKLMAFERAAALAVDAKGRPLRLGQTVQFVVEERGGGRIVVETGVLWAVSPDGWGLWTDASKSSHITKMSNLQACRAPTGFEAA